MYIGQFYSGQSIYWAVSFINEWGDATDPILPSATLWDPAGNITTLPAPTQQGGVTGEWGGAIDTSTFTLSGVYRIVVQGMVPNLHNVTTHRYFNFDTNNQIDLIRKILTNKIIDNGTLYTIYEDDDTTILGQYDWDSSTNSRSKLT